MCGLSVFAYSGCLKLINNIINNKSNSLFPFFVVASTCIIKPLWIKDKDFTLCINVHSQPFQQEKQAVKTQVTVFLWVRQAHEAHQQWEGTFWHLLFWELFQKNQTAIFCSLEFHLRYFRVFLNSQIKVITVWFIIYSPLNSCCGIPPLRCSLETQQTHLHAGVPHPSCHHLFLWSTELVLQRNHWHR